MSSSRIKRVTFSWKNPNDENAAVIQGTVRSRLGIDEIDQVIVLRAIYPAGTQTLSEREALRLLIFTNFVLQTEHLEGHDFVWATVDDNADRIRAAFESWKQLPAGLMIQWRSALQEADSYFS